MRIAVVGAGAVGSVLGVLLARAGHHCVLVARPDHCAAIRVDGLRLTGCLGSSTVRVEAVEHLCSAPDLALLTTKVHDGRAAIEANHAALTGVPLLVVQNGLSGADIAAELLPPEQIMGAAAMMAATYLTPGHVEVPFLGRLVVGRRHGPPDRAVAEVVTVLAAAMPTSATANLLGAQWTKLLINLSNALQALTGLDDAGFRDSRPLVRLGSGLVREGFRVAAAAGVRPASLPDAPVSAIRLLSMLPSPVSARVAAHRLRRLAVAGPVVVSTLQSVRRGRPTEIDYLNGEVVRAGRRFGVPTPLNERVVSLVHEVERSGRSYPPHEVVGLMRHESDHERRIGR